MTTRNPMNERYNSAKPAGVTRKSAASAKPKAKAATSVYHENKPRQGATERERKALKKQSNREQKYLDQQLGRKFYSPDTKKFKIGRVAWVIALILAMGFTIGSFLVASVASAFTMYVCLGLAYASIGSAVAIDFLVIRKERKRYVKEHEADVLKERRYLEKVLKEAHRAGVDFEDYLRQKRIESGEIVPDEPSNLFEKIAFKLFPNK